MVHIQNYDIIGSFSFFQIFLYFGPAVVHCGIVLRISQRSEDHNHTLLPSRISAVYVYGVLYGNFWFSFRLANSLFLSLFSPQMEDVGTPPGQASSWMRLRVWCVAGWTGNVGIGNFHSKCILNDSCTSPKYHFTLERCSDAESGWQPSSIGTLFEEHLLPQFAFWRIW